MTEKYIIDKTDIHDLLTGKDLPLTQGRSRASAFCVEIAGSLTNGDVVKALFPNARIWFVEEENCVCVSFKGLYAIKTFTLDWWNALYKTESGEE